MQSVDHIVSNAFDDIVAAHVRRIETLTDLCGTPASAHDRIVSLSLLSNEQQRQVHEFLKDCQDLYARGYLKDGSCIKPDAWFKPLPPRQHQQIVAYLHSVPMDAENSKILNWYGNEREFRLERAFSPVSSR